jgi:3-hydroxyacyl-CoA dehydrogenase
LTLDLETLEYRAAKSIFATLELTKTIDKPINRLKFCKRKRKAGEFYRKKFF